MNTGCSSAGVSPPALPSYSQPRNRTGGQGRKPIAILSDAGACTCTTTENPFERATALTDNAGRPVVLVKFFRVAEPAGHLPVFKEGQDIVGNVTLNLTKPEYIKEIILYLRGAFTIHGRHPKIFVEVKETLWGANLLDPAVCTSNGTPSAQLKGYFCWPFSLRLPTHIAATDSLSGHSSPSLGIFGQLPPTFSATDSRPSINYELTVVTVKRQHDITLSVPFIYIPITRPPCPSSVRDVTLNNQIEDTWEVFQPSVRGIAFAAYNVDVTCTLALPRPLCYTLGSAIRCILALESTDEKTIELLANPRVPVVQLCQCAEDTSTSLELKIARIFEVIRPPEVLTSRATLHAVEDSESESGNIANVLRVIKAGLREGMHSKILVGEIPLHADLTPSFSFDKMVLKYEVQILPFKTAGFASEDNKSAVFRADVKIVSNPAITEDLSSQRNQPAIFMPPKNHDLPPRYRDRPPTYQVDRPVRNHNRSESSSNVGCNGLKSYANDNYRAPTRSRSAFTTSGTIMTDLLDSMLDLMRRLPPTNVEENVAALVSICPDYADDLLGSVDQPLRLMVDRSTGREYLACDYNRDGESYRSPWSNEYDPPLDDGTTPSPKLRKLEIAANEAFDTYRELSVLTPCFLSPSSTDPSSGSWDSIHVFEASERGRNAFYKLTSTIMLHLVTQSKVEGDVSGDKSKTREDAGTGTITLSGSMTRQIEQDHALADAASHITNTGRMVEDQELKMRNLLQDVYFGKTRDVVHELRSAESLAAARKQRELQKELVGLMRKS
ncbi:hypothetical protein EW145_g2598 [Phellinidium pouzarii]|uniref:F-actin-capping protein subunit beta n=1 Tax=Phellinidium pouzarii TaxID=167371 RepID=A0A4S4LA69_9AGAM|nr:hypothetical protein EW145_g2598 [Phellinidium pouzarii]